MAPIKFEENLKDKLEKRTLSPTSESWSKLLERLDAEEEKYKSPIFWWLSIAAGLIIMMAVSAHFFKANDTNNTIPKMVDEDTNTEQLEEKTPEIKDTKAIELAIEDEVIGDKNGSSPFIEKPQIKDYKKVTHKKEESKSQLAENRISKGENNELEKSKEEELNNDTQNLINDDLMKKAVANALINLKSENNSVTEREIDSLLKIASKELFKERLQKETTKTVDANALLMSVEDEMGQSFRSKVFEALKESYKTVKTAVAERNN